MKKNIFLLLILTCHASCSTPTENNVADQIIGEWVWIESSGRIAGTTETPASTEKTITLKISNRSIKQYVEGTLKSEKSYKIEIRKSLIYGEVREMIVYDHDFKQIFSITGNQLILTDDCYDCFRSKYQRK